MFSRSYSSWRAVGSSGRVNLTVPCLQSHAFPKTFVPLEVTSGLQSMNSACTAARGYLSTCTAADQEAKESADAHSSPWAMWEAGSVNPSGSLAYFLWPLMHTHLPAHPGDWHLLPTCTRSECCPGTAMEVSSSSLPRSVVLHALFFDFGNLPPREKIQKSF